MVGSTAIELPAAMKRGKADTVLREQWLAVVAVLMARGIRSVTQMQRSLTRPDGYKPTYDTVKRWMETIKSRYSDGLSRREVEEGRGLLLAEMEEVSQVAWTAVLKILAQGVEVPNKSGGVTRVDGLDKLAPLLSQITSANKQRATLYGLDKIKVDVTRVTANLDVAKIAEVALKHGIPPEALKGVGSNLAKLLSQSEQAERLEQADE